MEYEYINHNYDLIMLSIFSKLIINMKKDKLIAY